MNNFIPYVICETALGGQKKLSIGDMAYSPDEYMKAQKEQTNKLIIDIDWYINQQLLPPITRLIEHIEGIEVEFVAQCLGADGKKYKYASATAGVDGEGDSAVVNPIMKTETTDKLQDRSVANLKITCPFCDEPYDFPEIFHTQKDMGGMCSNICPGCKEHVPDEYISNRVQLFLKQLTTMYYRGK